MTAVRHAIAGEQELRRASWAAGILTEFDEDAHRNAGYMTHNGMTRDGERRSPTFDREAALARNMGQALQPEWTVHRDREAQLEKIDEEFHDSFLFEDQQRAEGWNIQGRYSDASRRRK